MVPNAAAPADKPRSKAVGPGDRLGANGRYELLARIGTGGMGSVFRARDHKLGCERAIKVLYPRFSRVPAFVERFRREAMAASRITHPNIVGVVDVAGPEEQPVYLVMELLEGQTLSQMVRGGGRLPWGKVRLYVDQIAAGLGAAHAQGVVHRDVKPGNCVVLSGDQVKVLDFGIAKVTDMPAELVPLTAAGEIIGTCSYMAPEQIRGKVDRRSDIYALGAVIYRLLTGHTPFEHTNQDQVLLAHLQQEPPRPSERVPDLPDGVDDLVLTMLAKRPDDRFADMDALRRALSEIDGTAVPDERTVVPGRLVFELDVDDAPTQMIGADGDEGTLAGGEVTIAGDEPEDDGPETNVTARAGSGALAELEARQAAVVVADRALDDPDYDPEDDRETNEVEPYDEAELAAEGPEGEAGSGPAGTLVIDDPGASRGGTVVVDGYQPPAKVPDGPGNTEPGKAPVRVMGPLSAPDAPPPRLTRAAVPEPEESPGMLRGMLSALGGVALAGVVVAVWLYTRGEATDPAPSLPAASIPAAVDETEVDETEVDETEVASDGGAPSPEVAPDGSETESLLGVAGGGAAPPVEPEVEPETTADSGSEPEPEPEPEPEAIPKPRPGKKRRPPPVEDPEPDPDPVPDPEPDPDPDPESNDDGKKSGDLRDPF